MPKGKVKTYNNVNELLEQAKINLAKLIQEGVEQQNWDELDFDKDVRIADFVEKRFAGMNENNLAIEHDINLAVRRVEHMEDSPRKEAAKVVIDLYKQNLFDMADLGYQAHVLVEAQTLANNLPRNETGDQIKRDRNKLDAENLTKLTNAQENFEIYQNMMATFFQTEAIRSQKEGDQLDQARIDAQNRVLAEIGKRLPAGPEYDTYRTMAGYVDKTPEPLVVKNANLIMNSNVLTDVSVNNFTERIHAEKPKRVDIEWGASTFDNMMDELYNNDELKAIKRGNKNYLDTVFLNGKPALEVLPKRNPDENERDYLRRMKCEVVSYALEGKGKIDIAPYAVTNEGFEYKDPVPVHVKVNLKEEISLWRRFKRHLGISSKATKKETAERISLDELGKEERHDEIKAYVRGVVERENNHLKMKKAMEKSVEGSMQADLDFFGFMIEGKSPKEGATLHALVTSEMEKVANVPMEKTTAEALEISYKEYSASRVPVMKTLNRPTTRTNLCRLFALTQGMTSEEVLSNDPALKERKSEIGKAFVDKISIMSEKEYAEKNGKEADYKAYFRGRRREIGDTLATMMQVVGEQPLDFFRDPSITQLAEDYPKADFIISVTQDLFQCCPDHVKNQNYDEMERLEQNVRSIGELRDAKNYCENYVASDSYVKTAFGDPVKVNKVAEGAAERAIMENMMKKCQDVKALKEMNEITNSKVASAGVMLRDNMRNQASHDPKFFEMCQAYAQSGKNPVVCFNEAAQEYHLGKPDTIAALMKAQKNGNINEMLSFEEISKDDIQASRRKHMTPKELEKEKKALEKADLKKNKTLGK